MLNLFWETIYFVNETIKTHPLLIVITLSGIYTYVLCEEYNSGDQVFYEFGLPKVNLLYYETIPQQALTTRFNTDKVNLIPYDWIGYLENPLEFKELQNSIYLDKNYIKSISYIDINNYIKSKSWVLDSFINRLPMERSHWLKLWPWEHPKSEISIFFESKGFSIDLLTKYTDTINNYDYIIIIYIILICFFFLFNFFYFIYENTN